MVAPAVGLDDEAEVGPEEVDLEFVDHLFGERDGETGCGRDWSEEPFQLVVGEAKSVLVEDPAEGADAGLTGIVIERPPKLVCVDGSSLSASLIARSIVFGPATVARSRKVRTGWVRGMFSRVVISELGREGRRWHRTPRNRASEARLTLTSM